MSNNEDAFARVSGKLYPGVVDNIHWNRVAALAVTLIEMLEFGKAYAKKVVENSQALGENLDERGVRLRGTAQGFSKSHQLLLDYDAKKLEFYSARLEQANIIVDNGGRIGTSEMTRMGYGIPEMAEVAELLSLVILGKKPADIVKKRVRSLVKGFSEPKFVLKSVPELLSQM
jgi:glycine hydroxymethyltransferase